MPKLDPQKTALILIDLQQGLLGMPLAPHGGEALIANSLRLAARLKRLGGLVIQVRVAFSAHYADRPGQYVDQPMSLPADGLPAGWADFPKELNGLDADIVITKRQWSAFYGTELDLQLRRRGMTHVIVGGIATNFGVESTARDAWQHDYAVLIAEDLCATFSDEMHLFALEKTLPRIAKIRKTDEIIAGLNEV
ncbi:MAG TPA: hydrolase [Terriglobia bacterium]|nr:hydrolase [Terriglobia bacterium]